MAWHCCTEDQPCGFKESDCLTSCLFRCFLLFFLFLYILVWTFSFAVFLKHFVLKFLSFNNLFLILLLRRATATQTLSARATLCAVKTTVLLLEERTRIGGWTAVCLQASQCRSQNQPLNLKLHRKRSLLWNLEPPQKRSQLQNQNQPLF